MPNFQLEVDGASLAATYSPAGDLAVIAVHGASEGTRDFYLYRHLHDVLPARGIGVVTFDRRGSGESTGETSRGSFQVQTDDALKILESLDVKRAGIWGISQGGWVGPLAAAQSPRVAFLVLLASIGVTPAEQMRYAVGSQLRRAGYDEEVVTRAINLRRMAEEWLRGDEPPKLRAELRWANREPWWELTFLPDTLPDEAARSGVEQEMFFEPEAAFARTKVPTLLFYGDDDEWAPVQPSIEAWQRARGDEVEIVVLPGTGHEPTLSDGRISPLYERKLIAWLASQRDALKP
jgi:uncharacterized protein